MIIRAKKEAAGKARHSLHMMVVVRFMVYTWAVFLPACSPACLRGCLLYRWHGEHCCQNYAEECWSCAYKHGAGSAS